MPEQNRIIKTSDNHKTVTFAVLVPDEVDYNQDVITKDEIIKTAHNFVENLDIKKINVDHKEGTEIASVKIVESYILPQDMEFTDGTLPEGTRMVAIKFEDDQLYQDVLDGKFVGVSMEGLRYKD